MTFTIRTNRNIADFMRASGYRPIGTTPQGETNCVRPLGADYPRFHVYAKENSDGLVINLHLDQKKPSYGGSSAHNGEYEGEIIEEERRRIESFMAKNGASEGSGKAWWEK